MSNQLTEQDECMLRAFTMLNPSKVELVECELMPPDMFHVIKQLRMQFKACYCNAAKSVLTLRWRKEWSSSVRYVLGVADMGMGFYGHAWIEVGGVHYDPTFEILEQGVQGRKYFAVSRFTPSEIDTFINQNNNVLPAFPEHAPEESFDFDFWRTFIEKHELQGKAFTA
ncbi:hypothetical protein P3551_22980 [Vibrio parahaemolyticus]|uniref:hypothetical protein n=1 Tax=Vibrio parahaemolyticus TaxID=670 RepID=UPI00111CC9C5|nr:hypothetical protein [Vibrio parahaemolyticus]MBE3985591.1 hypothetical protein [Vibrio parahaemolyticus]MBE4286490.1 hypothetical protein [Vibrio parahaemolyticus]MDF4902150.1 hypothetical protein [Vibrio parahaemolyticus]TOH19126.1 hypothetical protein CGI90_03875 [Vibrio parahaemolyticus]HCG7330533.1 hypothetical protein [Vibrio parahaemolyticus]